MRIHWVLGLQFNFRLLTFNVAEEVEGVTSFIIWILGHFGCSQGCLKAVMSPLIYQRLILFINPGVSQNFIDSFITITTVKSFQIQHYASYWGHKYPTAMYDISKNSEKWIESKYEKSERLGIVPGTWFGKRMDVKVSNIFSYDILYTVRFVWMRRIQRYHFHYVNRVGKWPPQQNTAFLIWHHINGAALM